MRSRHEHSELNELLYVADHFDFTNFVDVGANIGNHCHFLSQLGAKGYAFEPSTKNFELLAQNAPSFVCEQVALGNRIGTSELVVPQTSLGNSHLVDVFDGSPPWARDAVHETVSVRRLDDYEILDASLLKIDAEGSELNVLRGGRETIAQSGMAIWIELHDDTTLRQGGFSYTREEISSELNFLGYQLHRSLNARNHIFLMHGHQVMTANEAPRE